MSNLKLVIAFLIFSAICQNAQAQEINSVASSGITIEKPITQGKLLKIPPAHTCLLDTYFKLGYEGVKRSFPHLMSNGDSDIDVEKIERELLAETELMMRFIKSRLEEEKRKNIVLSP